MKSVYYLQIFFITQDSMRQILIDYVLYYSIERRRTYAISRIIGAKENNSTPEKVEIEMRKALQLAGYDIEPAIFIALAASKVKKTIYRN